MTKNYQYVNSFVYTLSFRRFLKQLLTHLQPFFDFNEFFFKKIGITWANFSLFGKFPVSTVLLRSAFKVSEQLFLLIFKIFAGIFLNGIFVLRLCYLNVRQRNLAEEIQSCRA